MTKAIYRNRLPQLNGLQMLTDGGLETTLIFHQGLDLPYFAAFDLLKTRQGCELIREYYRPYIEIAQRDGKGFILDSPTWRASRDWGNKLGYNSTALAQINKDAISLLADIRSQMQTGSDAFVLSGNIGPRGDGYDPSMKMTCDEAQDYHSEQSEPSQKLRLT